MGAQTSILSAGVQESSSPSAPSAHLEVPVPAPSAKAGYILQGLSPAYVVEVVIGIDTDTQPAFERRDFAGSSTTASSLSAAEPGVDTSTTVVTATVTSVTCTTDVVLTTSVATSTSVITIPTTATFNTTSTVVFTSTELIPYTSIAVVTSTDDVTSTTVVSDYTTTVVSNYTTSTQLVTSTTVVPTTSVTNATSTSTFLTTSTVLQTSTASVTVTTYTTSTTVVTAQSSSLSTAMSSTSSTLTGAPPRSMADSVLSTSTQASFNPMATNNLAVYFGHSAGNNYAPIMDICNATSPDILIIGFVRSFNGPNSPPSVDFGPRCKFPNGQAAYCPGFTTNVANCQQNYNKRIFISIGGSAGSVDFTTQQDAIDAAQVIWDTFGAGTQHPDWRPFGSLIVDGYDIDHESGHPTYWADFAKTLRMLFAASSPTGQMRGEYFISAAPLCANTTSSGALPWDFYPQTDFVWARFYNTAKCQISSQTFTNSLLSWYSYIANYQDDMEPYPKLYIGVLSFNNTAIGGAGSGFVEAYTFAQSIKWIYGQACANVIGGTMLWDGTFGLAGSNYGGLSYDDAAKFAMTYYKMKC